MVLDDVADEPILIQFKDARDKAAEYALNGDVIRLNALRNAIYSLVSQGKSRVKAKLSGIEYHIKHSNDAKQRAILNKEQTYYYEFLQRLDNIARDYKETGGREYEELWEQAIANKMEIDLGENDRNR